MSRWRRFVLRPVAVLALLLFAATALLWVRSYARMDDLFLIYKGEGSEQLSSLRGEFYFRHTLPHVGKRRGVARISHRSDRVAALPPRPWTNDRLRRKWLIFEYDDSLFSSPARRGPMVLTATPAARKAIRDAWAALIAWQSQPPTSTDPTDPRVIAYQQKRRQLIMNYQQAQARMPVSYGYSPLPSESYYAMTFPMWLLMLPAIVLVPVAWLASWLRRARRARRGLCRACGYDLTANASGICPECGQPTPAAAAGPAPG